jgi:aminopeptidase N
LLRGFSAPVVLSDDLSDDQRLILLAHDTDPFNRWEAAQQLALSRALTLIKAPTLPAHIELDAPFVEAMRQVLRHPDLDSAFKELVLTLPGQAMIAEQLTQWDPQRIHAVREGMRLSLAEALFDDWVNAFAANQVHGGYSPDSVSCGKRALANLALHHIVLAAVQRGDSVWPGRAYQRFKDASDMSTRLGALSALVNAHSTLAEPALAQFHALFSEEALVIDKWFALQAATPERDNKVWTQVRKLMQHPDFSLRNPNRARSLITTFCHGNPAAFHRTDAAGYVFWSERVMELDGLNPQVASRLARALDHWKKLVEPYRSAAGEALKRVSSKPDLSKDVREVVLRALG